MVVQGATAPQAGFMERQLLHNCSYHTSYDGEACPHRAPCSIPSVRPLGSSTSPKLSKLSMYFICALIVFPPRTQESAARFSTARRLTTFLWNFATYDVIGTGKGRTGNTGVKIVVHALGVAQEQFERMLATN